MTSKMTIQPCNIEHIKRYGEILNCPKLYGQHKKPPKAEY